jgi:hypothetical protein
MGGPSVRDTGDLDMSPAGGECVGVPGVRRVRRWLCRVQTGQGAPECARESLRRPECVVFELECTSLACAGRRGHGGCWVVVQVLFPCVAHIISLHQHSAV